MVPGYKVTLAKLNNPRSDKELNSIMPICHKTNKRIGFGNTLSINIGSDMNELIILMVPLICYLSILKKSLACPICAGASQNFPKQHRQILNLHGITWEFSNDIVKNVWICREKETILGPDNFLPQSRYLEAKRLRRNPELLKYCE